MDIIASRWVKITILSVIRVLRRPLNLNTPTSLRGSGDEMPLRSQGQKILIYFIKKILEAIMNLILFFFFLNLIPDCIFLFTLITRKIKPNLQTIPNSCGGISNMPSCAYLTPRSIFLYMLLVALMFIIYLLVLSVCS